MTEMKKRIKKALEFIVVVIALVIGVLTAKSLSIESMLRGKEEAVTLAMTEEGIAEDYVGLPAADDIPRIEDAQMWEDTWQTSCVTVEPTDIIPTGIGVRNTWVSAYTSSRRGGQRYRADVSQMAWDVFGEYGEYFLIQLPDQSYILAQMSADDAKKIKSGKETVLPIGRKAGVHRQALPQIEDLCREYDANTEGLFYCINDRWNESHDLLVQIVRIGSAFLIAIVLGTILITVVGKIFKEKEEE